MDQQLVVFRVSDDLYGLGLDKVSEIIVADTLLKNPELPEDVEGMVRIGDDDIPVVDFRKKIGIYTKRRTEENWVLILQVEGKELGILVDGIEEMCQTSHCDVRPVQSLLHTCHTKLIKGFGSLHGRKVCVVCAERFVDSCVLPTSAGVSA